MNNVETHKGMTREEAHALAEKYADKLPLIEVHELHTPVGSLLNRDFNNRQKTIHYGDELRGRYSSASLLHDIRFAMEDEQNIHTRMLPTMLQDELSGQNEADAELLEIEKAIAVSLFSKDVKKPVANTEQILDIDQSTIAAYVNAIKEAAEKVKAGSVKVDKAAEEVKKTMIATSGDRPLSAVTALFGRMAADQTFSTVYSALLISHGFTIDSYKSDYDDYTAVDDLLLKSGIMLVDDDGNGKKSGAAYMDTADISANVYYRYGAIVQNILFENLCVGQPADRTEELLEKTYNISADFLERFISALPSAKQTRNFARSMPDAVYIDKGCRMGAYTAANRFARPIHATKDKSICDIGVERLQKFAHDSVHGSFVDRELTGQYWLSDIYDAPEGLCASSFRDLDKIVRP